MKSIVKDHPSPFRTVRECGQLTALKFASLLQQKSEKLSKSVKYMGLLLFVVLSLGGSFGLLMITPVPAYLPPLPPGNKPHYLPDRNLGKDSLTHISFKAQPNNNHD